jgi:hypothetical protein
LLEHVLANPALSPALTARLAPHAGRWLAGQRGRVAEAATDLEPEPDLQAPDGTLVYSAPRQREWRDWNNRQLTKQFEQKLQPLQHVAQTFEMQSRTASYSTSTQRAIAALKAEHPDFEKHMPAVGAAIQADPVLQDLALSEQSAAFALRAAWDRVRLSTVVPAQLKTSEATALANAQQRAAAATPNPAAASTTTPKPTVGDARAALEYANQQLGAA